MSVKRIKIKLNAWVYNCQWCCTEGGKKFDIEPYKELGCYVVMIDGEKNLVNPNHAEVIK